MSSFLTNSGMKQPQIVSIDPDCPAPTAKKEYRDPQDPKYWVGSAEFWNNLSKVWLTRRALEEFDRRTVRRQRPTRAIKTRPLTRRDYAQLKRFACEGGPDLSHLRGFDDFKISVHGSRSTKRPANSRPTLSTKRTTPFDPNYMLKLSDAGVFTVGHDDGDDETSLPANYDDILARLSAERRSLSPSRFTEDDFRHFRREIRQAPTEASTMNRAMTIIEGQGRRHYSAHGVLLDRIEPFNKEIAAAKPDIYDGVLPRDIDSRVRKDLDRLIMPSTDTSRPAVPNFFMEVKGNKSRADAAMLQGAHDGALGARAIHAIQNYGTDTTIYDGKAYCFSSTLHNETLALYSMHPSIRVTPEARPEYHMTQLRIFAMTDSSKTFREGATHYRNARDMAGEMRDLFVKQANEKAELMPSSNTSQPSPETDSETSTKT